jgi:hypothetical protein
MWRANDPCRTRTTRYAGPFQAWPCLSCLPGLPDDLCQARLSITCDSFSLQQSFAGRLQWCYILVTPEAQQSAWPLDGDSTLPHLLSRTRVYSIVTPQLVIAMTQQVMLCRA